MIVGAACAYVLLALTFAYLMSVIDGVTAEPLLTPIAGNTFAPQDRGMARADTLYFSFVTLTTLGYGDIAPATLVGRLIAGAEALTGQLFLTIFVARLIGLHLTRGDGRA